MIKIFCNTIVIFAKNIENKSIQNLKNKKNEKVAIATENTKS